MKIDREKAIRLCWPSPQQSVSELNFIMDLIEKIKPKKILEIGTGCGATTTVMAMSGAKVVTVDWIGNPRQYWDHPQVKEGTGQLDIDFHLVKSSQTKKTADLVRDEYDLVVIDADHSWVGGKKDWDLYSPMGPVVAIHDIVDYENKSGADWDWFPTRFWQGLKTGDYTNSFPAKFSKLEEFVDVPAGGWGVLFK